MIEVKKNDFMRAVYYHNLDVKYSCNISNGICHGQWRLGYNVVCKQTSFTSFANKHNEETLVNEYFKARYIDTTPDNAFHCRTCGRVETCCHVHYDVERFCGKWIAE